MARREQATAVVDLDGRQAEKQLEVLTAQAVKWRAEMLKAKNLKDFEGYAKAEAELKKVQSEITKTKKLTIDYSNVVNNLSSASLKEMQAAAQGLNAQLSKMGGNHKEWDTKVGQLQKLNSEISRVKSELRGVSAEQTNWFNRATDGFNKYFAFVTTVMAGLTGIALSFRSTVDAFNEFEAGAQELSAITELEGADLEYLKNKAKEFSVSVSDDGVRITKSATDILTAFKIMGGAKAELLGNKEALAAVTYEALVLASATKMDTAVAVESLANTMNQFGASAEQARRYVNALAAGSTAGAAEVNDISASMVKMGTVAASANISVEESVAMLETLAEKGVKAEVAGTQLKTVLLKLQAGAAQFNPAIVGMAKALENLDAANLSTEESMKLFGIESVVAGNILVDNREKFEELTVAVTGTNVAYEQAAKNSDTATASLEQARNRVNLNAIELGQRLSPALTFSTNLFGKFLEVAVKFLDWADRNAKAVAMLGKIIAVAGTAIASYTAAKKLAVLWEKNFGTQLSLSTIAQKVNNVATIAGEVATQGLAVAKALLAGNIRLAAAEFKLFSVMMGASPVGLVTAAIGAAATALIVFRKELFGTKEIMNPMVRIQDTLNVKLQEETEKLSNLKQQLELTKPGSVARREIIEEINDKYPDLLGNMDAEKASLADLTKAIDDYVAALNTKLEARILEDEIYSIYQKKEEVARDKELSDYEKFIRLRDLDHEKELYQSRWADLKNQTMYGEKYVELLKEQKRLTQELKGVSTFGEGETPMSRAAFSKITEAGGGQFEETAYTEYLKDFKANTDQLAAGQKRLAEIQKEIETEITKSGANKAAGKSSASGGYMSEEEAKKAKKIAEENAKLLEEYRKKILQHLTALENQRKTANARELDEIRERYNEELVVAEGMRKKDAKNAEQWAFISDTLLEQRNEELSRKRAEQQQKWETSLWNARKEIGKINQRELMEAELAALDERYVREEIGLAEFLLRKTAIEERYEKERAEKVLAAREKWGLVTSAEKMAKELADLKLDYDAKLLTAEEYEKARAAITQKYADERVKIDREAWRKQFDSTSTYFQNAQQIVGAFSDFFSAAKESELDAAGKNEEKKKQIAKRYADIEMGIKIAQIIASTALSIMQGYAQLGPIGGTASAVALGLTGGLQVANAIKERNRIRGFETGWLPVQDHLGRDFKARKAGKPTTQLVDKPSVFLAGEGGKDFPEMIIDGYTYKNLQVNSPEAIEAIYAARDGYQGFEGGMYPPQKQAGSETTTVYTDPELRESIRILADSAKNGFRSYLVYQDIKKMEEKEASIKNTFDK